MCVEGTLEYFSNDFPKGLFPLDINKIVIENCAHELHNYIYGKFLSIDYPDDHFLPQIRCFASKHGLHLRRTHKLDPIAEYYIYNLVYRTRTTYRKDFNRNRKSFGHRFENGKPVPLGKAYREFKKSISIASSKFKFGMKFDIATYFNSLYHHDIVTWFSNSSREMSDVEGLGIFLREINSGRSVDCLPQGIHPCKVIGAEFLKFIDNNGTMKSELMLRFMDDVYVFSDNQQSVEHDFILFQKLAGDKGLNFNPSKTRTSIFASDDIDTQSEDIRIGLLNEKAEYIDLYSFCYEEGFDKKLTLNEEQLEYLYSLLHDPTIDEMDAELILTFMTENGEEVLKYFEIFFSKFPFLSKKLFYFCKNIEDKSALAQVMINHLEKSLTTTEEQLFWFAKIAEQYLFEESIYGATLHKMLEHNFASDISISKILELSETRFGLPEIRDKYLRNGTSSWLSWASAIGTRSTRKANRNQRLSYFAKISPMNRFIADAVKSF
ncbi:MAG: orotate phosphoribosyltransferase [Planctomycetes bacterium]|nr:orotate phosphoribosyltransferase [Planctomycetota bacterium]